MRSVSLGMEIIKRNNVYSARKSTYLVSHSPLHIFNASRPFRQIFFSSTVKLPVEARHNAARIFFENSGVMGSLGELIPNITL